jgi:hypothetical protein
MALTPRNLKAPILLQFLFFEPLIELGIEFGNTSEVSQDSLFQKREVKIKWNFFWVSTGFHV